MTGWGVTSGSVAGRLLLVECGTTLGTGIVVRSDFRVALGTEFEITGTLAHGPHYEALGG